jgi:ketosteroid isomerase-like protein
VSIVFDGDFDCPQATLEMIERQARAWVDGNFAPAATDWHPEGVLTAPGNRVLVANLPKEIAAFHRDFGDLRVAVTSAFESPGGWVGLEWLWDVARRADGARSVTADAIIVVRRDGLIREWREYFDTAGAVEQHHG